MTNMNRHMRRAANKTPHAEVSKTLEGIREFASIAEEIKPFLAKIGALESQLEKATQILRVLEQETQNLRAIRDENIALRAMVNAQVAVFRRMFAQGMGVPLGTVLAMETEIQHDLKIIPAASEASTSDSGSGTQS